MSYCIVGVPLMKNLVESLVLENTVCRYLLEVYKNKIVLFVVSLAIDRGTQDSDVLDH